MELGVTGKVVFIAGGSKGMGRRAGEMLAQDGASVAIVALEADKESIDEAVSGILERGGQALVGPRLHLAGVRLRVRIGKCFDLANQLLDPLNSPF